MNRLEREACDLERPARPGSVSNRDNMPFACGWFPLGLYSSMSTGLESESLRHFQSGEMGLGSILSIDTRESKNLIGNHWKPFSLVLSIYR